MLGGLADRVSRFNRQRKYRFFIETFKPDSSTKILDVGASEYEYHAVDNLLEKTYPHPENITVLGIDDYQEFRRRYPHVKTVTYRPGRFPFDDNEFDICWSNAVLEHVGQRERQVEFLREIRRVSRRAFVTTPNRYFPVEVHTRIILLHYLPKPLFDRVLIACGKSFACGDHMNLLGVSDAKRLLHESGIERFRIVRNRLFGLTLDFIMTF
jgi:SAM-dependent methyltransferase